PADVKGKFEGWMFGCDICQDVCPWNRFATPHHETQFLPTSSLKEMKHSDWEELTEETYQHLFKDSPLKRARFEGIKRNISFLTAEKKQL
ncbi:MAG TPA: tRNA epoxyqueuosine(34) reductase QueG, partial [Chitinophagales bacterium]|nr:tRNA epoxyqueuosine(34) reductase QueG [Chitinophagales bacterium]